MIKIPSPRSPIYIVTSWTCSKWIYISCVPGLWFVDCIISKMHNPDPVPDPEISKNTFRIRNKSKSGSRSKAKKTQSTIRNRNMVSIIHAESFESRWLCKRVKLRCKTAYLFMLQNRIFKLQNEKLTMSQSQYHQLLAYMEGNKGFSPLKNINQPNSVMGPAGSFFQQIKSTW